MARMSSARWAQKLLLWEPLAGKRRVGRPAMRWEEDIRKFVKEETGVDGSGWILLAQEREDWKELEDRFAAARATRTF